MPGDDAGVVVGPGKRDVSGEELVVRVDEDMRVTGKVLRLLRDYNC